MFKCSLCDSQYKTLRSLKVHAKTHGSDAIASLMTYYTDVAFKCLSCNKEQLRTKNSVGKFCSNRCQMDYTWHAITKPKIIAGLVCYNSPAMIKFLTERDGYKCSCCGVSEWQGKELSLDVDHTDGNNKNDHPSNLRFLCPNCHRQTPTWGNKKRKNNI